MGAAADGGPPPAPPPPTADSGPPSPPSPLAFELLARSGAARAARMTLPHFACLTPMFMPVGTQGAVKGLTAAQLEELGCQTILANTYHMENRPGAALVAAMGGLHAFTGWPRAMLTDSGGFQMVSLLHLADVSEEGVAFQSPTDGTRSLLTPERSIAVQNALGADIIMALDDVVPSTAADAARFAEATARTTRWLDRCVAAHARPAEQALFAIVQGGLDPALRARSVAELAARRAPGYAIGGLAGGEDKRLFVKVVAQCCAALPSDRPRYVMGIGHPLDVVICSALGADMYDSVYPTRTARFGVALVPGGTLKLKHAIHALDTRPIDPECECRVCAAHSRAFLHPLVARGLPFAANLLSYHNIAFMMRLAARIRAAIQENRMAEFVRGEVAAHFPRGDAPAWVAEGCALAGIALPAGRGGADAGVAEDGGVADGG